METWKVCKKRPQQKNPQVPQKKEENHWIVDSLSFIQEFVAHKVFVVNCYFNSVTVIVVKVPSNEVNKDTTLVHMVVAH